jgi:hypothetical protein
MMPGLSYEQLQTMIIADPILHQELTSFQRLIDLMRNEQGEDAPPPILANAVQLLSQSEEAPRPGALQRLIAAIQHDSWRMPFAKGVRAIDTGPRAILLNAGDRQIDLQIQQHGDDWQVYGQVLGPEEPGAISLRMGEFEVLATLNPLGEFVLPPVQSGRYTLKLRQGQREIIVPNLELGPNIN